MIAPSPPTGFGHPPQVVEQMTLPPWQSELETGTVDLMAELAAEHGFTDEQVDRGADLGGRQSVAGSGPDLQRR